MEIVQPFSNCLRERLPDIQLLIKVPSAVSEVRPTRRAMTETIFCVCAYALHFVHNNLLLLRTIMCTSKSGKFLAQSEKMQPLATLVPAFKAIETGVEPMRSDCHTEGYV